MEEVSYRRRLHWRENASVQLEHCGTVLRDLLNNGMNNNYYYYNSNKLPRRRTKVFFSGFRQFSAYFGHPVYFGLSNNRFFIHHFFILCVSVIIHNMKK